MTTISDKDRAVAQAMAEAYHAPRGALAALSGYHVRRWLAVEAHVLATHECPTVPVWRPTTAEEIQPGWEVRSYRPNGMEATWGVAHHRDGEGDWRTKANAALTYANLGWSCETTAPLPAVDHAQVIAEAASKYTPIIAEAAREYVRGLREWASGTHPYPAAAGGALVAAVEAEHTEKEEA